MHLLPLWIYLLWVFHIHGIIQFEVLYDWLLLLNMMFSVFIHVTASIIPLCGWVCACITFYSCIHRYIWLLWITFGASLHLVIVNNATVNFCIQIFVSTWVFISPGSLLKSVIVRSYMTSMYKLLRKPWDHLSKQLYQSYFLANFPNSPHPYQYLLLSVIFSVAIPMDLE